MGIFDFLKKKKDDDLGDLGDLGADLGPEPAFPGQPQQMPGIPGQQQMPGQQQRPGVPGGQQELFTQPGQTPPPPPGIAPTSMQLSQPPQSRQQGHMDLVASRIEVISSKIDSLKASIDRLNEKIDYLERMIAAGGGRRYG